MFRPMRRFKQQLSEEECLRILKEEPRGVMAVHGEDGYPYAFPMDYVLNEENGKLYFHCAKTGHKIDALKQDERVSFCVYDQGFRKEGDWALNIKSVVIFGRIRIIEDTEEMIPYLQKLGGKYFPSEEYTQQEIERGLRNVMMLELSIDHMTGKLVNES